MSGVYRGSVSIVKNTKEEICLKKDDDGVGNAENAKELFAKMLELSEQLGCPINKYSYLVPEGTDMANAVPVLEAASWGGPRIVLRSPTTVTKSRPKVVKLF